MSAVEVYKSITIKKLINGVSVSATLYSTSPLYQTFKRGTNDFNPNWETMPDGERPVIFPRVSPAGGGDLPITDIGWRYNQQQIMFNSNGMATAPDVCAGKVRKTIYNGVEAIKVIGNVASDTNNTSDTISFFGKVRASGQLMDVSAETTLLIEEGIENLYRLILEMTDHIIDGNETSIKMQAKLFNDGNLVTTGAQYEFIDTTGAALRPKSSDPVFNIHKDMVHGEVIVTCKGYIGNKVVGQDQRQVIDKTDPYEIDASVGDIVMLDPKDNVVITFYLLNQRTGQRVSGATFTIRVFKENPRLDITSEFTKSPTTITIPGSKIDQYDILKPIAGPATLTTV